MLEKIEQDELQTIQLPTDQIQWYKKNHELIVDGKMFDVKSIHQVGDSSIITGLFDEEDTELHEALAGMHEQKNKGQNNSSLIIPGLPGYYCRTKPIERTYQFKRLRIYKVVFCKLCR